MTDDEQATDEHFRFTIGTAATTGAFSFTTKLPHSTDTLAWQEVCDKINQTIIFYKQQEGPAAAKKMLTRGG